MTEPSPLEAAKRLLIGAAVGSCTCNTKSPELVWHDPSCRYVILMMALENVEIAAAPADEEHGPPHWRTWNGSVLDAGERTAPSPSSAGSATAEFEFREFQEDAFRSMEVQICPDTRTVQFSTSDHGGDHPTSPSVAIDWNAALDLANWIVSRTGGVAQPSWQPIETAPKDGVWFVALQDGETYPCEWREEQPDEGRSHKGWFDLFNSSFEEPTHWTPAGPALPSTEGK